MHHHDSPAFPVAPHKQPTTACKTCCISQGDKLSQEKAYKLYQQAARKRFVLAYYPMGFIHYHRQTPEDLVMSYAWFQAILDWEPTDDVQALGQLQDLRSNAIVAMAEIEKSITPEQVTMAKLAALGLFEE